MNTITQVERGGLFEISEATLAELKSSKYYNDDLAPTSISERSWTTYSITMLCRYVDLYPILIPGIRTYRIGRIPMALRFKRST